MTPAPIHLFYETAGNQEYCLSFGASDAARTILIIPPFFDEMNRTRRMIAEAMRHLAKRGVRAHLLDLPGCNESVVPAPHRSLSSWRVAVTDAAVQLQVTHIASIRGGCLIDDAAGLPIWRLAPVRGAALLKNMLRTRIAGDKEVGVYSTAEHLLADGRAHGIHLAGQMLSPHMVADLEIAIAITNDLVTEGALADVAGTPLWLRAEPGESPEMSAALAARLDAWSASCGG